MKDRAESTRGFEYVLARKIYANRISMGLTQEQVVAQLQFAGLDMSRQVYARVEKGLRPLYPLEFLLLCDILNIDPAAFPLHRGPTAPGRKAKK